MWCAILKRRSSGGHGQDALYTCMTFAKNTYLIREEYIYFKSGWLKHNTNKQMPQQKKDKERSRHVKAEEAYRKHLVLCFYVWIEEMDFS